MLLIFRFFLKFRVFNRILNFPLGFDQIFWSLGGLGSSRIFGPARFSFFAASEFSIVWALVFFAIGIYRFVVFFYKWLHDFNKNVVVFLKTGLEKPGKTSSKIEANLSQTNHKA